MKLLYRALPIILSVGLFGCGNSSTQDNANAAGATVTEHKDNFVSKLPATAPTLKVAMTGDLPPFSFQDDYGNMQGTDVDSIRAIGEEQGFKVEFYKESWQDMFDSVESGKRDLAISGISYKDDRAIRYGLSTPYFFNPATIMYLEGKFDIKDLNDIKGLKTGTLEGSKEEDTLKEMGSSVELVSRSTAFLAYQDLVQGNTDVFLYDMPVLQYIIKGYPEHKVKIVPYEAADAPSAQQVVLMAKENTKLIKSVNEGITKLKAKGTFKEIEEKWLGATEPATKSTSNNQQSS
ncbi:MULTISPECIES: transporter substrate-binding domain-containing protein [Psychrobacter]|uniref:Amino acid ABC transporter substrate-binding protein, PAAT family n=1 Tax=Psychrobacter cryohalolentis (strain ATCC BAA-1226 / DSM 17306 / VKM B-2378 / K5) TaxID=335284 RepID=Q1QDT6_PSYCK|nr:MULTISPECIES: transporter substrate-binding domain-containing protein [Psychrobacter]ABE74167.1 amino acid ABC transporter substrate-binding protein, PAAT family [Psychrobacter cryohalolentis K5]AGP48008.1 ABC transporter substrate-binding protein [Psychrobacter sp. G]ASE26800.1 ABC transporter substrate-binding protein [Psychrobacter cryohalolentis]KAA0938799.1 transporter substrate-binding domain-containing protein [Psychrobacter sp. ANT_H59]MBA2056751.1 transporter substrate-binding doma|tara:strand:- start:4998 stop:5870 length:873 start_codon:yes stop_codon:yes gene_type:complete